MDKCMDEGTGNSGIKFQPENEVIIMNNFYDSQKTNVIFGKDTHKTVGEEIKKYGNRCLIVHDGGSYLTKILEDVRASLGCQRHLLL